MAAPSRPIATLTISFGLVAIPVKSYEFAKGKHVMFTAQELKVLEDATSPSLEIAQFVPLDSVDPVYFMHFKAEVRDLKDFGYDAAKVSESEVKLARQLIDQLSAKQFDPNEFKDEHRARVAAEIKKKVQGKEISLSDAPAESPRSNVVNLMDALKASLARKGAASEQRKAGKKASGKRLKKSTSL